MRNGLWLIACMMLLIISIATAQAAIDFRIVLPPESTPETMTILCGEYGNGLALSPIVTKQGVYSYTEKLSASTQTIKLLIHQPGYQIVAAEIGRRDFGKPFTPRLISLRNQTVRLRVLDNGGKPIPGEHIVIKGGDWEDMAYYGYGDGMVFYIKDTGIAVTTDDNGEATVNLPAWSDDPYYTEVIKETPGFYFARTVTRAAREPWDYVPNRIDARREYPDPIVITKQYRATLTVRFDAAYLAQHGVQGILGDRIGRGRAIVVIGDPAHHTSHTMRYADDCFTAVLPPGAYSLGIEIYDRDAKGKSRIRYIPIQKELLLTENEERDITVR